MTHVTETIAALSTPAGESGIAVVRMTGPQSFDILARVFRSADRSTGPDWEHRRIYHGTVVDGDDGVLDEVLCTIMRGPESYTGEDTVEISCHGNAVIVSRLLRVLFAEGARPAEPGEFTKRAFLNGKMDLIQAEAVADLIHARSDLQRRVAHAQLGGHLSRRIDALADELLELLGTVEANIDFIEEDIDILETAQAQAILDRQRRALDELLSAAAFSRPFRDGYQVVIAGPVNAGKSSLFNRLLGENRAIVTEIPGTTRDILREPVVIEGLLFVLHDTAGLRGTLDRVEQLGVGRAQSALDSADMVLFVIDAGDRLTAEDTSALRALDDKRAIVVLNKADLPPGEAADRVVADYPLITRVHTSAVTGVGLDSLREELVERVGRDGLNWIARERIVLNSRIASLLEGAQRQIDVLAENLRAAAPLEILALDARETLAHYEKATGKRYSEDLLDTIFSRFCIGK